MSEYSRDMNTDAALEILGAHFKEGEFFSEEELRAKSALLGIALWKAEHLQSLYKTIRGLS